MAKWKTSLTNKGKESIFDKLVCHKHVVTTMRQIAGSIINNQASGGNWLISEAIVDNMRVYVYCYGYEVDDILNMELEHMVEE